MKGGKNWREYQKRRQRAEQKVENTNLCRNREREFEVRDTSYLYLKVRENGQHESYTQKLTRESALGG